MLKGADTDEPVPGLEFAADVMKRKGFDKEAQLLLDEATRIKLSGDIKFEDEPPKRWHHK